MIVLNGSMNVDKINYIATEFATFFMNINCNYFIVNVALGIVRAFVDT